MSKHVNKTNNSNSVFAKIIRPGTKMNNKSLSGYNKNPKKSAKRFSLKKLRSFLKIINLDIN